MGEGNNDGNGDDDETVMGEGNNDGNGDDNNNDNTTTINDS